VEPCLPLRVLSVAQVALPGPLGAMNLWRRKARHCIPDNVRRQGLCKTYCALILPGGVSPRREPVFESSYDSGEWLARSQFAPPILTHRRSRPCVPLTPLNLLVSSAS